MVLRWMTCSVHVSTTGFLHSPTLHLQPKKPQKQTMTVSKCQASVMSPVVLYFCKADWCVKLLDIIHWCQVPKKLVVHKLFPSYLWFVWTCRSQRSLCQKWILGWGFGYHEWRDPTIGCCYADQNNPSASHLFHCSSKGLFSTLGRGSVKPQ